MSITVVVYLSGLLALVPSPDKLTVLAPEGKPPASPTFACPLHAHKVQFAVPSVNVVKITGDLARMCIEKDKVYTCVLAGQLDIYLPSPKVNGYGDMKYALSSSPGHVPKDRGDAAGFQWVVDLTDVDPRFGAVKAACLDNRPAESACPFVARLEIGQGEVDVCHLVEWSEDPDSGCHSTRKVRPLHYLPLSAAHVLAAPAAPTGPSKVLADLVRAKYNSNETQILVADARTKKVIGAVELKPETDAEKSVYLALTNFSDSMETECPEIGADFWYLYSLSESMMAVPNDARVPVVDFDLEPSDNQPFGCDMPKEMRAVIFHAETDCVKGSSHPGDKLICPMGVVH